MLWWISTRRHHKSFPPSSEHPPPITRKEEKESFYDSLMSPNLPTARIQWHPSPASWRASCSISCSCYYCYFQQKTQQIPQKCFLLSVRVWGNTWELLGNNDTIVVIFCYNMKVEYCIYWQIANYFYYMFVVLFRNEYRLKNERGERRKKWLPYQNIDFLSPRSHFLKLVH